jgi:hypothetical protein
LLEPGIPRPQKEILGQSGCRYERESSAIILSPRLHTARVVERLCFSVCVFGRVAGDASQPRRIRLAVCSSLASHLGITQCLAVSIALTRWFSTPLRSSGIFWLSLPNHWSSLRARAPALAVLLHTNISHCIHNSHHVSIVGAVSHSGRVQTPDSHTP